MGSHTEDDDFPTSSDASLLHDDVRISGRRERISLFSRIGTLWWLHLLFFLISLTFLITGIALRYGDKHKCVGDWYPLIGYHPPLRTVRFDGTFDRSSPYKGPPSPSVDAAWAKILPIGGMSIPESVFQTINASRYASKVPDIAGGGRLGLFEAIHQIHCVKSLWMSTYSDYYVDEYKFSQEEPEEWREHMDHCADMLRQKLMCDADATLLTYNWIKNHYGPHPNFNVEHKCRDYDRLLDEAARHRVDGSLFPKGYFIRPTDIPVVDFEEPPFDPEATE